MDNAFEYLERASKEVGVVDEAVYEIRAKRSDASVSGRGIFLREPLDGVQPVTCIVEVKPVVHAVSAALLGPDKSSLSCTL